MTNYEKVLLNLVKPLCSEPDNVLVKQMQSIDDNQIVIYVYAPDNDLSRLIGRKGIMAQSLRTMLQALAKSKKRITIKFEAI